MFIVVKTDESTRKERNITICKTLVSTISIVLANIVILKKSE